MGRKSAPSAPDTGAAARAAAEASRQAAEAAERAAREREDRARAEFQASLGRVKNFTGMTAPEYVKESKQYFSDVVSDQVGKYESFLQSYDPNVQPQVERLKGRITEAKAQTNLRDPEFQKYVTGMESMLRKSKAGEQNLGFGTSDLR